MRIDTLFIELAGKQNRQGISSRKGDKRINGTFARCFPYFLHNRTHECTYKLHQAKIQHHNIGKAGQRNAQRDRDHKTGEQERDHIIRHQRSRTDTSNGH